MKKIMITLFFSFCILGAFSEESKSKSKASEFNNLDSGIKTYKFEGFQFLNYQPSSYGLQDIINDEYGFIKENNNNEKFAIAGHSQGGLPAVNAKIRRDVEIIHGGCISVLAIPIASGLILNFGEVFGFLTEGNILDRIWNFVNDKILPNDGIMAWLKPCLKAISPAASDEILNGMGEIRDMIPQSNFIRKYVLESNAYTYKVQTGTERLLRWTRVTNRWGWQYWVLRWHYTPVYSWYTAYNHVSKLPNEIPVGYIVGLKNNTLDMLPDSANIREKIDAFGHGMDFVRKIHIAKCCFIWGLFSGSPRYARQCAAARDYCYNIDSNINKLLGSDEHDCLVAKESQFIPKTIHPKSIDIEGKPYVTFDYNHAEIFYKDSGKPPEDVKRMIETMIKTGTKKR
ncbi:hypothetical protein [Treponema denticola]|uniref:hypothetical protein n=1 Tax=Treponema denticola TaxID=158 RepID=UPI0020A38A66|nr:hypothetical protein [Treponema denticola]UTC82234.1 hypothetical protein HGJ18_03075 [Treponema denticola]